MNWPLPIRIVGVGSSSGDDAVGWNAVRRLQREREWGSEFEFHAVEGGQRLLDLLDGRGSLIIVDAFSSNEKAGGILRLEWPSPRIETLHLGTTHHVRPAEALQLAAALGILPATVVIWAVAGEQFVPQSDLSPTVAASVPVLVQQIVVELDEVPKRGVVDA